MAARADQLPLPAGLRRMLLTPALGTVLFAAAVALIGRHTRRVTVSRMSDEWLAAHERETHTTD